MIFSCIFPGFFTRAEKYAQIYRCMRLLRHFLCRERTRSGTAFVVPLRIFCMVLPDGFPAQLRLSGPLSIRECPHFQPVSHWGSASYSIRLISPQTA